MSGRWSDFAREQVLRRQGHGDCKWCGAFAKLYALPPIHDARDLCIDCSERLAQDHGPFVLAAAPAEEPPTLRENAERIGAAIDRAAAPAEER
jgi:hypothetical protein